MYAIETFAGFVRGEKEDRLPKVVAQKLREQSLDMNLGIFRQLSLISAYKEHCLTKGAFYLFTHRLHTLLKAVWFDDTAICLLSKRLEKG